MTPRRIAILGTVGVPGAYGGFETLAENLVRHHQATGREEELTVCCSARAYAAPRPDRFLTAHLHYLPLDANGAQSIAYDVWALLAFSRRADVILLLGTSGALALPLIRLISRARIVTNIDGIEWRREKWKGLARTILRWSERAAVRFSHVTVADNEAIADHVRQTYGAGAEVIAYGGDHALATPPALHAEPGLPARYAFALCRIEPENNVAMILEAFAALPGQPLVFVGNWGKSDYGRALKARYAGLPNLHLLDPVYDPARLRRLRGDAWLYVHGHSAGGTNPSLVEMMQFGIPVLAHGCAFNRHTTEGAARYFDNATELARAVEGLTEDEGRTIGRRMGEVAQARYTWSAIGAAYFKLLAQV